MAPSAMATTAAMAAQSMSSKPKRPLPPGIQTNGIISSQSSPSPSLSASRLPPGTKLPPGSGIAASGNNASMARSVNRARREVPGQLLGRGQRNSSAGLRSASIVAENVVSQSSEPQPYIKSDGYILKKYRGNPPSLIIHMHPTHFRFDQQEGSFSYKSPMKVVIEHLQQRTIPHDLLEFFHDVPFYEGCMIVQIHDHKSSAQNSSAVRSATGARKAVPFSIHNYNVYITPSSYVPYPSENLSEAKGKDLADGSNNLNDAEKKDKENMPAPALPGDVSRNNSGTLSKKPKIHTIVLRPTAMSGHVDVVNKILESRLGLDGRRDSRQDGGASGSLSASIPQTPNTVAPNTPQNAMAPPAKRLKKAKIELDSNALYAAESQITLATSAPLVLDLVDDAAGSAILLEALTHPMHSEKPPSPKARKRTVAEMAADEAQAADQERYMLIMDELRTSKVPGAQGGANPTEGDGQAGGTSFEPRFESFRTIENIKHQHEEKKKLEKLRQQENDRKVALDKERQKQREDAEKRDLLENARQMQMQQSAAFRNQQIQEAQRRTAMAGHAPGVPRGLHGVPAQIQGPHAHPQLNGVMTNNMQAQSRFQPQQVSQAQMSSPIVRNGTPHSHSSPTVNNLGNIPMQQSTSSLGGSPPRPGSVVNQNHAQISNQVAHGMTAQRSQQSHTGTPRMPSGTPQVQSTPLSRQISQSARMTQASPLQGAIAQAPHMPMMANGQQMPMNMAALNQQHMQAQQQQQYLSQQQMLRANQQNQAMQGMRAMSNGQPMNSQQAMMQQAMLRQQQQMQQQMQQQGGLNPNIPHMAQNFAQMAPRGQGLPQNVNQGFNPGMQNMQQMHHLQQMQMHQIQQNQMMQGQMQQGQVQPGQAQQAVQNQYNKAVLATTNAMFNSQLPGLVARYGAPANIPAEATNDLRQRCQKAARQKINASLRPNGVQNQQQIMAAQGNIQNMNVMPNGMGMQRQQGM